MYCFINNVMIKFPIYFTFHMRITGKSMNMIQYSKREEQIEKQHCV
jgi:hypothetical protein